MDEAEGYLAEILPFIGRSRNTNPESIDIVPQRDNSVVVECIDTIVKWAGQKKQQDKVFEVSQLFNITRT